MMSSRRKFQSTPSEWRETGFPRGVDISERFQSTPSEWRETTAVAATKLANTHFNPLPPSGGRPLRRHRTSRRMEFQSTPSEWRETYLFQGTDRILEFQSTPSEWRETPARERQQTAAAISIHSLRVEGDDLDRMTKVECKVISIHSLRVEGDGCQSSRYSFTHISIHSLRVEGDTK